MFSLKENSLWKDLFTILGWITASMSLASFIQRIFSVGLGAMTSSFVGYYRQLSHAIFGVPAELLGIMIPRSLIDFWALSFVCAGAYARSNNVKYALAFRGLNFKSPSKKLRIAVFLVFGFSGAGLFVPLSALSITTYVRDDITRDALKNLIVVMVVLGGFFILNAFSPSAPNV